jgi:rRNA maturation RNase YbeY
MIEVALCNRQQVRPINLRLLRKISIDLIENEFAAKACDLSICLMAAAEMAAINQRFLEHSGSTDVITFDYAETSRELRGEIFICIQDAVDQAKNFKTSWQSELVRYVIHGILHLQGYDDLTATKRRVMKREEERILRATQERFVLNALAARKKRIGRAKMPARR